jgi:cysteine desulfurase
MADRPIYLDYMSTTPVDPRVIEKMIRFLGPEGAYGNASTSSHIYGIQAAEAVEIARGQVAHAVGTNAESIIFTSGATEANNLALIGSAKFYQRKGKHIITVASEHKSILDCCKYLEKEAFNITYLTPQNNGLVLLDDLKKALRSDTILVSIMHANNEIGVIQNIAGFGDFLKDKGVVFHVDAAQSAGKLPINLRQLSVNLMSFSAHKNYGPKGVGALYVRSSPRTRLYAQSYGGSQENALRSGTLPTHQIVGMGEAFRIAEESRGEEQERILRLRTKLWEGIRHLEPLHLNGDYESRIAGNLNITFKGIPAEELLSALHQLAISTTSACASATRQSSHVLKAIGLSEQDTFSAIRLALGRFTTEEQINTVIHVLCKEIPKLQKIHPV